MTANRFIKENQVIGPGSQCYNVRGVFKPSVVKSTEQVVEGKETKGGSKSKDVKTPLQSIKKSKQIDFKIYVMPMLKAN